MEVFSLAPHSHPKPVVRAGDQIHSLTQFVLGGTAFYDVSSLRNNRTLASCSTESSVSLYDIYHYNSSIWKHTVE